MRILARIETAKPPDLEEINQIAKSIGRIGARIGAGVRHEISSLLPQTLIKPYVPAKLQNLHTLPENSGAGARIETARRRDPGKINQMAESIGRIGARIETQIAISNS